jgi:hypothetical protein
LKIDSYYVSKFLILMVIALIQVTMLFGIVRLWCGPPGLPPLQWLVLAILAVAGTALGLLLSAFARTRRSGRGSCADRHHAADRDAGVPVVAGLEQGEGMT